MISPLEEYFRELEQCNHLWESIDNSFGHLLECKYCYSVLVNGHFET